MTMPDALMAQAAACEALGSPFMGRLMTMLARTWRDDTWLADVCDAFQGDQGASGHSLPLRLAGGLHALVLTGRDPGLVAVYPPAQAEEADLEKAVWAAIDAHVEMLTEWMQSAPQTNEVRRSAVIIPAAHWLAERYGLPFVTSELGASAGLNLGWDGFALGTGAGYLGPQDAAVRLTPDWQGAFPATSAVHVAEKRGVDLNPIDTARPDQQLRLLSYLWPDQPHRQALTRAAIAARTGEVDRGDAVDWLETRLSQTWPGHLHLIYHTIAWQYFPAHSQARGTALIEAAGARATGAAPLAWLRFEADGTGPGAGITLRLWPGDERLTMGRADFHGRWVNWVPSNDN